MSGTQFEWDSYKSLYNAHKHGVTFMDAQQAFLDPNRFILEDFKHSENENRYYCFGKVDGEVLTVRFTYRDHKIRIFGAGYWRKGKVIYEQKNNYIY